MVAVLLRLKLHLFRRIFRVSVSRTVGIVIGAVYAAGLLVGWGVVAAASAAAGPGVAGPLGLGVMAVVTVGMIIGAIVFFGVDDTLNPAVFALLPVSARRLMPGLLISGFIGVPGIAVVAAAAVFVGMWVLVSPVAGIAAVIGAVLGLALLQLLVRVLTSGFASMLSGRRFRDVAAVLIGVVAVGLSVGINALARLASLAGDQLGALHAALDVLGWTPFGAPWALPSDVATGRWWPALARLVVTVVFVTVAWLLWERMLTRALTDVAAGATSGGVVRSGGRLDRWCGTSRCGAIVARCLRYWRRDPRYLTTLVTMAFIPVVLCAPSLMSSDSSPVSVRWVGALIALMAGVGVAADTAYDSSALWTHVSTGVRGVQDRRARVIALLVVAGPLLVAVVVLDGVLSGWGSLPGTIGVIAGVLGGGLGVGSAVGSVMQGVVPQPGESPFARGGGAGLVNLGISLLTALGAVVAGVPAMVSAAFSHGADAAGFGSLAVGLVCGIACAEGGIRWGGRRVDRHWPELLASVTPRT